MGILNAKNIETDAHLFFFHLRCCYYYFYSAAVALHMLMNNQMNNDLTMNHSNLFHFSSPFSLHKIHIVFFVAIGVMSLVYCVYMCYCLLFFDLSSQLLLDHCSALRIKSLEFVFFRVYVCVCVLVCFCFTTRLPFVHLFWSKRRQMMGMFWTHFSWNWPRSSSAKSVFCKPYG